jgi:hypothetical protein
MSQLLERTSALSSAGNRRAPDLSILIDPFSAALRDPDFHPGFAQARKTAGNFFDYYILRLLIATTTTTRVSPFDITR